MLIAFSNLFVILFITALIGSKKTSTNITVAIFISLFLILEALSYCYFTEPIDHNFLFFLFNFNIFHIAFETKLLLFYFGTVFFIILTFLLFFVLRVLQIRDYRKPLLCMSLIFLFSPVGFLYKISASLFEDAVAYFSYKKYDYQQIYKEATGNDYVSIDELKVTNKKEKHKNLVMIYLESFDQSYLTNAEIKKFAPNIIALSKQGEFYRDIEQIYASHGTISGIFTSQCGAQYDFFSILFNPYGEIRYNNKLVCLSDILNRAGYKQVFLGGANKKLFNKGNFFLSHRYDTVEDNTTLIKRKPKPVINSWGIADYDLFRIAKNEYKKLSRTKKPFNLTLLTTATHNPNGVNDERCPNKADKNLLKAVKCTDYLVKDFVDFIKKQPNFKDTIVVVMPDHKQYDNNELNKIVKEDEKLLYTIILNSGKKFTYSNKIKYTDIPRLLLDKLNVESNATFLGVQEDSAVIKNFVHKIHKY